MTKIPQSFLDQLMDRVSLAKVVGEKVSWDQKKSNPGRGEYWACCPFHQEKTPSFKVDDKKGFYYCFGCHSKGGAIRFVCETSNVGFTDAVAMLARDVGMEVPAPDPEAKKKMDRQSRLTDVLELAVAFYRLQLNSSKADAARQYLDRRGMSDDTRSLFNVGYAPKGSPSLQQHLSQKGVAIKDMVDAGLVAIPDDGGKPYDRFRDRIMFPIRSPRDSCVGFGGRAMDPNARAKYLNSPETDVFKKSRLLYNLGPARNAMGKTDQLVVAEGYMDVIALVAAGIESAVAPLGTAITEQQLGLMWRISPEPIITLDGDAAGRSAAMRLIDLALPNLAGDRSLRFVMMPEGKDPDDLIRDQGVQSMREMLAKSQSMFELLWQRETQGRELDSPERRAALQNSLERSIGRIKDQTLQKHYRDALRQKLRELFGFSTRGTGKNRGGTGRGRQNARAAEPVATTRSTALANSKMSGSAALRRNREAVILAAAILNPSSALELESELESCPIETEEFASLHNAFVKLLVQEDKTSVDAESFRDRLNDAIGHDAIEWLRREPSVRSSPCLKDNAEAATIAKTLKETLHIHAVDIGLDRDVKEIEEELFTATNETFTIRMRQVVQDRDRLQLSKVAETPEDDDEIDLKRRLRSMEADRIWEKP